MDTDKLLYPYPSVSVQKLKMPYPYPFIRIRPRISADIRIRCAPLGYLLGIHGMQRHKQDDHKGEYAPNGRTKDAPINSASDDASSTQVRAQCRFVFTIYLSESILYNQHSECHGSNYFCVPTVPSGILKALLTLEAEQELNNSLDLEIGKTNKLASPCRHDFKDPTTKNTT